MLILATIVSDECSTVHSIWLATIQSLLSHKDQSSTLGSRSRSSDTDAGDREMSILRRFLQTIAVLSFVALLPFLRKLNDHDMSRAGTGASRLEGVLSSTPTRSPFSRGLPVSRSGENLTSPVGSFSAEFHYGMRKPPGSNYTQIMVVPRLKIDDISWIREELPDIDTAVYVANDPTADFHPPRNKGHEVMVYLTYIIDHYSDLPDTIIFMHAHRWTHHNIELLGYDSAEMIRRLSNDYVAREGYVNMRCRWYPGCPEWLHPKDARETLAKQEGVVLSQCWHELFPSKPLPEALGQGCCAQFALSKNRVLSIPLSRFIFYRDWMLRTPLSDYVSGRIWEYLWQYLFTGESIYCPSEHACHCQGFGVCFGGATEYEEFRELGRSKEAYEKELEEMRQREAVIGDGKGREYNASDATFSDQDRYSNLTRHIEVLEKEMQTRKLHAIKQGDNRSSQIWVQREDF